MHWVVRREISHCRNKYGEYFGITVAGYPEAHPDAIVSDPEEMDKTYWKDLHYLKEKVVHSRSLGLLCGILQVPRFRAICKSHRSLKAPMRDALLQGQENLVHCTPH